MAPPDRSSAHLPPKFGSSPQRRGRGPQLAEAHLPQTPRPHGAVAGVQFTETEVNGIRTFVADTPGPLCAELLLRVGHADETFTTRGITHLVEHLALFREDSGCPEVNGYVSWTFTSFRAVGNTEQVGRFLDGLVRQLARLPLDRMVDECRVLAAERMQRGPSIHQPLFVYRYGLRDFGLAFLDDASADQLDPQQVQDWADQHAAAHNAVLLLSGPPPPGFTSRLPDGVPLAVPDPARSMLAARPVWIHGPDDQVLMHAVVARSAASIVTGQILRRRLYATLREEHALAYSPTVAYEPMDARFALMGIGSDVAGEPERVARLLIDTISDLATGRRPATGDEIEMPVGLARQLLQTQGEQFEIARQQALSALLGRRLRTAEQVVAAQEATTAADVMRAAAAVLDDAMIAVPEQVALAPPWRRAPACVEEPIGAGRRYRSLGDDAPQQVVVNGSGLTVTQEGEHPVTIVAERTVAAMRRNDGGTILLSEDGCQFPFHPALWRHGDELARSIERTFANVPTITDPGWSDSEIVLPERRSRLRPWPVFTALLVATVAIGLGWAALTSQPPPGWLWLAVAGGVGIVIGLSSAPGGERGRADRAGPGGGGGERIDLTEEAPHR